MHDDEENRVRTSSIIVELHRLMFTNPTTLYERIYRDTRVRAEPATGIYRFSVPTGELEVGFDQLRLRLPDGAPLNPKFGRRVGDAVSRIEDPAEDGQGSGCG